MARLLATNLPLKTSFYVPSCCFSECTDRTVYIDIRPSRDYSLFWFSFFCRATAAALAVLRCLSVCPVSVTFVYCFETSKHTLSHFLPRDAMHKRGLCRHAVSVCLSVSRSWILSKRIIASSKIFYHREATPF